MAVERMGRAKALTGCFSWIRLARHGIPLFSSTGGEDMNISPAAAAVNASLVGLFPGLHFYAVPEYPTGTRATAEADGGVHRRREEEPPRCRRRQPSSRVHAYRCTS